MMIIVNRMGESITGSYNGIPYGIAYDEQKYKLMQDLAKQATYATSMEELVAILDEFKPLTVEGYKELTESKCSYIWVNNHTGKYYLKLDDVTISSQPLPQAFVDRIITSVDKNIDFMPLIKAWTRFLRNPYYNETKARLFANYLNNTYTDQEYKKELLNEGLSEQVAHERATRYQTPVTDEGLICSYKVSREILSKFAFDDDGNVKETHRWKAMLDEDTGIVTYQEPAYIEERIFEPAIMGKRGDAFTSGDKLGHVIRVGHDHALTWEQCVTKDFAFGEPGLHCGNLNYIRGYQGEGTVTHEVFIDPSDIARFTNEEDGAVVVRRYFVHKSFAGVNKQIYYSSSYARMTDTEYEQYLTKAIEETGKQLNDAEQAAQQKLDELSALKA